MPENTTPHENKESTPSPDATPTAATTPMPPQPPAPEQPAAPQPGAAAPKKSSVKTEKTTEKKPVAQRTWVKVTGGVAAAVVLLGIGFGSGWAVSDAVEPELAGNPGDSETWQPGDEPGDRPWQDDDSGDSGFGHRGPGGGMPGGRGDMRGPHGMGPDGTAPDGDSSDVAPDGDSSEVAPDENESGDSGSDTGERSHDRRGERGGPDETQETPSEDDSTQSRSSRF